MDIHYLEVYCSRGECETTVDSINEHLFNYLVMAPASDEKLDILEQHQIFFQTQMRKQYFIDTIKENPNQVLAFMMDDSTVALVGFDKDLLDMIGKCQQPIERYGIAWFYDWEKDPNFR